MNSEVPQSASEREADTQSPKQAPAWIFMLVLPLLAIGGFFVAQGQLEDYNKQIDAAARFVPVQAKVLEAEVKAVRSQTGGPTSTKTHPILSQI